MSRHEDKLILVDTDADREARERPFQGLASALHKYYSVEFEQCGSDTLVVIFSPGGRPALRQYPFRYDRLFVTDKKLFYYLHNPGRQTLLLQNFIEQAAYRTVVFVGLSKGGVGSLLWSSLIERRGAGFRTFCLAFSPQTLLYPFNENLASLPSYISNMKITETNEHHLRNFERYGNLPVFLKDALPQTMIVYPEKSAMDRVEAHRLAGERNVELKPVDIEFHGSITPFVIDRKSAESIKKLAEKLYADAEFDADLKSTLPRTKAQFRTQFNKKIRKYPSLNTLIDNFCGFQPVLETDWQGFLRRWLPFVDRR